MEFTRLTVSRSTDPAAAHNIPRPAARIWLADPVDAAVPVAVALTASAGGQADRCGGHGRAQPAPASRAAGPAVPDAHRPPHSWSGSEADRSRWCGPPPMGRKKLDGASLASVPGPSAFFSSTSGQSCRQFPITVASWRWAQIQVSQQNRVTSPRRSRHTFSRSRFTARSTMLHIN